MGWQEWVVFLASAVGCSAAVAVLGGWVAVMVVTVVAVVGGVGVMVVAARQAGGLARGRGAGRRAAR